MRFTSLLAAAASATAVAAQAPMGEEMQRFKNFHPGHGHPNFHKLAVMRQKFATGPRHHKLHAALLRLETNQAGTQAEQSPAPVKNWIDNACQFLDGVKQALDEYCKEINDGDKNLCNGQVAALIAQLEGALQCKTAGQLRTMTLLRKRHCKHGAKRQERVRKALMKVEAVLETVVVLGAKKPVLETVVVLGAEKETETKSANKLGSWVDEACQFLDAAKEVLKEYCQEAPKDDQLCSGQIQQLIEQVEGALQCHGGSGAQVAQEARTSEVVYV